MKSAYQIIRRPVITEKGLGVKETESTLVFEVASKATKIEIKEAVLRGMGVAVLSTCAVQKELKAGQLHALDVSDLRSERDMFVVKDRRRVLPLPARNARRACSRALCPRSPCTAAAANPRSTSSSATFWAVRLVRQKTMTSPRSRTCNTRASSSGLSRLCAR